MQLILNTDTTVGIKRNMSELNEVSLVDKLDDVIQELKSDICSSNKENIQSQDNIITSDEKELNSDDDKGSIEEISATKPSVPIESVGAEIVDNKNDTNDMATDDSSPQISVKETQGIVDQQVPGDTTIDAVEQQTFYEEIPEIVDQQESSEATLGAVEQQASDEETLGAVKQQVSGEETLSAHDQQSASGQSFGVDDHQGSNEESISIDDQQVCSEENLGVDISQGPSEKCFSIDERQASNKETRDIDDQQASCDETLDIEDRQAASEKSIDVDIQQGSSEKTLDVDDPHVSSKNAVDIIDNQQGSSEDTLDTLQITSNEEAIDTIKQQPSSKLNLDVDQPASSEKTIDVGDQQNSSEDTFDNVIEESEKDDDSDPITITYENETHIEEKEGIKNEVQQENSPSEQPDPTSNTITTDNEQPDQTFNSITTDDCAASKNVEMYDAKEHSIVNTPELEKQKQTECIDAMKDDLISNKLEPSIAEKETLCHNRNVSEKENEIVNTCEPMEVDNNTENGDNCVKENTELICEENEAILALDEKDNGQEKTDSEDLQQTTTINIASDSNMKNAEIRSMDSGDKNEIEENSERNKDMEVDEIILQDKSEQSPQNKVEILNQENKIILETETQVHRNKLSEDLKNIPSVLKLSNTLDILSDDEDIEPAKNEPQSNTVDNSAEKQCINIEDDDDIMLIDEEDTNNKSNKDKPVQSEIEIPNNATNLENQIIEKTLEEQSIEDNCQNETRDIEENEKTHGQPNIDVNEKVSAESPTVKEEKPLVPNNFLKSYKKNLADMTREDLEEFCVLKIVESIVDRSNLSDIKGKLKILTQNIEEQKKKAMMLTKQNRDLQVVLKSVQEELKKSPGTAITPLKISRSVGMQVLIAEKPNMRRKAMAAPTQAVNGNNAPPNKSPRTQNPSPRPVKPIPTSQTIPVPRLVPASNNVAKNVNTITQTNVNNSGKASSPLNGIKTTPVPKMAEKRPLNKSQGMTVDLTDDEPPTKVMPRSSPVAAPPVRLLHPLAQNSPRKVYIPISGPQGNIRPGQTIMLKTVPNQGPRPRGPIPTPRLPQNQIRMPRIQNRHPAPLPEVKQYQTNHYKALPPAPDLKLSKVENGIVISWKIEGYQEDSYEEIASYQLYAYQESSSPPSTALWKKIGDVKALPLPMACTLTQFMAGYKYYFAVRAVDIRSRFGPFSLPGSILLLNKI